MGGKEVTDRHCSAQPYDFPERSKVKDCLKKPYFVILNLFQFLYS